MCLGEAFFFGNFPILPLPLGAFLVFLLLTPRYGNAILA